MNIFFNVTTPLILAYLLVVQEKRERLASFEHRFEMCQLAFAHLNRDGNSLSKPVSQKATNQTTVVVSDAEYMSWKHAVNDMYVTS